MQSHVRSLPSSVISSLIAASFITSYVTTTNTVNSPYLVNPHSTMILIVISRPNTTLRLQFISNHSLSLSTPAYSRERCQSPQISQRPVIACSVVGNGPSTSDNGQNAILNCEIFPFLEYEILFVYSIAYDTKRTQHGIEHTKPFRNEKAVYLH